MNKVMLVGNLARDPELTTTQGGTAACRFTLAVGRRYKNQSGEREADFIQCVAWRHTAEFISKYFTRGQKIGVCGSIQTRSYTGQDGSRRYATEVVADEAEFVSPRQGETREAAPVEAEAPMEAEEDDELPF